MPQALNYSYRLGSPSGDGQDAGEQKEYLLNLLRILSVFIACAAAMMAIPSVDIHQFSTFTACFVLALGLSLLGLTLVVYLVTTTSPRRNQLQLKPNHAVPMRVPAVIAVCSVLALLVGVAAMVLDVQDGTSKVEANFNWARYTVVASLGVVVLLSLGIIVASEVAARTSIMGALIGHHAADQSGAPLPLHSLPAPPEPPVPTSNAMIPQEHIPTHTTTATAANSSFSGSPSSEPPATNGVPSRHPPRRSSTSPNSYTPRWPVLRDGTAHGALMGSPTGPPPGGLIYLVSGVQGRTTTVHS